MFYLFWKAIPTDALFLCFKEVARILTACWNFFIYHAAHKDAHTLAFFLRRSKRPPHLLGRDFHKFACFPVHPFATIGNIRDAFLYLSIT